MVQPVTLVKKVFNFSAERYLKAAGDLFIYDGDSETALSMVDKTLEIEPHDTRALVLRGDILFCLNRDVEALQAFNQALAINGNCTEAYISKASLLDLLGKTREALQCCNKAFSLITPQNDYLLPGLYDQKILLLTRLNRFREAQQFLKKAANLLPETDYQYLQTCYKTWIDRSCRQRETRHSQPSKAPQLKVLLGGKS